MKTLADFKRATKVGTKIKTLAVATGFEKFPNNRVYSGQIRFVNKADTTGIYLKNFEDADSSYRGSFLGFDKASDWKFEGNVATSLVFGYSYEVIGV